MPGLVNTMASKLSNLTSDDYEGTCNYLSLSYLSFRNQLPGADRGFAGLDQHLGPGVGHSTGVYLRASRARLPHGLPLPHAQSAEGAGGAQTESE